MLRRYAAASGVTLSVCSLGSNWFRYTTKRPMKHMISTPSCFFQLLLSTTSLSSGTAAPLSVVTFSSLITTTSDSG